MQETTKKQGIVKKIILGVLCLVVLIFLGRMFINPFNSGDNGERRRERKRISELGEEIAQIRREQEQKNNNERKEFRDTRTPCQKYLSELDDHLVFHLLWNDWTPNWDEINQKLQQFPPEEVKEGLEKMIKNIRDNPYFKYNKEQTIKELEKILNEVNKDK